MCVRHHIPPSYYRGLIHVQNSSKLQHDSDDNYATLVHMATPLHVTLP